MQTNKRPTRKKTEKSITIKGRNVSLFEIDKLPMKIIKKHAQRGSHVTIPNKYRGYYAEIKIIAPRPFICNGCYDTISTEEHFSEDPKLCKQCFKEKQHIDKDECIVCGGKGAKKEYWARCEDCWNNIENEEKEEGNS